MVSNDPAGWGTTPLGGSEGLLVADPAVIPVFGFLIPGFRFSGFGFLIPVPVPGILGSGDTLL